MKIYKITRVQLANRANMSKCDAIFINLLYFLSQQILYPVSAKWPWPLIFVFLLTEENFRVFILAELLQYQVVREGVQLLDTTQGDLVLNFFFLNGFGNFDCYIARAEYQFLDVFGVFACRSLFWNSPV